MKIPLAIAAALECLAASAAWQVSRHADPITDARYVMATAYGSTMPPSSVRPALTLFAVPSNGTLRVQMALLDTGLPATIFAADPFTGTIRADSAAPIPWKLSPARSPGCVLFHAPRSKLLPLLLAARTLKVRVPSSAGKIDMAFPVAGLQAAMAPNGHPMDTQCAPSHPLPTVRNGAKFP